MALESTSGTYLQKTHIMRNLVYIKFIDKIKDIKLGEGELLVSLNIAIP